MKELNQYWFSVNVEPIVTQEQLQAHSEIFSNCFFPIGNIVDGRMLCRVLAEDFDVIKEVLDGINKQTILCGGHNINGYWLEGLEKNDAEFDKYMQGVNVTVDDKVYTLSPADNTSAGRPSFKNGLNVINK